jgi:release factor glutamine methyltransferase
VSTIAELLTAARGELAALPFKPPAREAGLLLGHVLGFSEVQILARDGDDVEAAAAARFHEILRRRLDGEPVAYLVGQREFYGRPFWTDGRALIPRPETEHLVEAVLGLDLPRTCRLLDLGTGSGCVAVTLACERPQAQVFASDLSFPALVLARHNGVRHGVGERLRLVTADLADGIDLGGFHVLASNPPYVDPQLQPWLSPEVRDFEPAVAVFAPGQGDSVWRRLVTVRSRTRPGTYLVGEIGFGQEDAVTALAVHAGWEVLRVVNDYAGIPRTVVLRHPPPGMAVVRPTPAGE